MGKLHRLSLLAFALASLQLAQAYGPVGHQMVGAIADEKLKGTPVGKKVAEMLDGLTLQKAAVIPDEIKGWDKKGADDPNIFHYSSRPRIDEQLRAFWRANPPTKDPKSPVPSHHWFHYTDVPVANHARYADGKVGRTEWDIVHMMRYCIGVLRGELPEDNPRKITRPIAIILLAHYVGDIHQPLHVGAQYFNGEGKASDPDKGEAATEDQGGNTITLQSAKGRKKLHGFWDNDSVLAALPAVSPEMKKDERRATTDAAMADLVRQFSADEPKGWRMPGNVKLERYPESWADEILPLAREAHERLQFQGMHIEQKDGESLAVGSAAPKPPADRVAYNDWAAGIVREELHKAGWRLADLLQQALQDSKMSDAAKSSDAASGVTSATTPAPVVEKKVVTLTKPVHVRVPYGSVQMPAGLKLPYSTRNDKTVRVRYLEAEYEVPISSTDLQ